MKKILFMLPVMLCGGVEKALISLIKELPKSEYNIEIYLLKNYGNLMIDIPSYVKCRTLPLEPKIEHSLAVGGTRFSIKYNVKEKHYLRAIKIFLKHFISRNKFAELNIDFDKIEPLSEPYDIAICFHIHSPFIVKYIAEKVKAPVKLAWIHNDFFTTQYDIRKLKKYLDCYNNYFAVSKQLLQEFTNIFPEYKNKTIVIHNIVSQSYIFRLLNDDVVKEYNNFSSNTIKILTIGRLEKQKGIDIAIKVCKQLKDNGLNIRWFVLGEGNERHALEKQIKSLDLSKYFFLLGNRHNPYPYINECDIYVQTSRHEGWGIAVQEAKILCKPIVFTNVAGSKEQIINGKTGLIVDIDENELFKAIKKLIDNKNIRKKFSKNLNEITCDVSDEIKLLMNYL